MHVDAQQALRLDAGKGTLGILDIGENGDAAPVIGFAIQCRADMARGALEQAHAEPFFNLFHRVGHGRAWQAEVVGRQRKALPVDNTGENPHGIKSVHGLCSRFSNSNAK
jgi:hypothetical protein